MASFLPVPLELLQLQLQAEIVNLALSHGRFMASLVFPIVTRWRGEREPWKPKAGKLHNWMLEARSQVWLSVVSRQCMDLGCHYINFPIY